jgi:hypothetical protein
MTLSAELADAFVIYAALICQMTLFPVVSNAIFCAQTHFVEYDCMTNTEVFLQHMIFKNSFLKTGG